MALTNSQKQAAFRQRRAAEIAELKTDLAAANAEIEKLKGRNVRSQPKRARPNASARKSGWHGRAERPAAPERARPRQRLPGGHRQPPGRPEPPRRPPRGRGQPAACHGPGRTMFQAMFEKLDVARANYKGRARDSFLTPAPLSRPKSDGRGGSMVCGPFRRGRGGGRVSRRGLTLPMCFPIEMRR